MPRDSFYRRENIQVTFQPNIGLDAGARQSVAELLNLLLADEAVLSYKMSRADGDTDGVDIPALHALYNAQYLQINAISSELAERIQIIGGSLLKSSKELIDSAGLGGELIAVPGIVSILADHEAFIRFLREDAQKCSELYEDQGTYALLINVMRIHEKMAWNLRSNIAREQFDHGKSTDINVLPQ
jgi:starvation-inducible DNA-binding protein